MPIVPAPVTGLPSLSRNADSGHAFLAPPRRVNLTSSSAKLVWSLSDPWRKLCRRRAGVQPGFEWVVGAPPAARPRRLIRPRNRNNFFEDEDEDENEENEKEWARTSRLLGIGREPEADVAGLRIVRLEVQHFQVMLPRLRRVAQGLRAEIGQRQMRADFIGTARENFLELIRRVHHVARRLEREGEIVTGIHRVGLEGEGEFVAGQ